MEEAAGVWYLQESQTKVSSSLRVAAEAQGCVLQRVWILQTISPYYTKARMEGIPGVQYLQELQTKVNSTLRVAVEAAVQDCARQQVKII